MRDNEKEESNVTRQPLVERVEGMLRYGDGDLHEEPLDELARRRWIDNLLQQGETYEPVVGSEGGPSRARRRRLAIAAAAGIGALAAVWIAALSFLGTAEGPAHMERPRPATVPQAMIEELKVVVVAGRATLEERTEARSQGKTEISRTLAVDGDRAIVAIGKQVVLLLEENTHLVLERSRADAVSLFLDRGALLAAVAPIPGRPAFSVGTAAVRIAVTGTVFGARGGASTAVEVFRGEVAVTEEEGTRSKLVASQKAAFPEGGIRSIEPGRLDRVLDVVALVERLAFGDEAALLARVDLTEVFPSSPAGDDTIEIAKHGTGAAARAPSQPADRSAAGPALETPEDLLRQAKEAKRSRLWQEAVAVCERLILLYPGSAQARVALVLQGSLELGRLGRPERAVDLFTRYLATAGDPSTLSVEARWGRAQALGALGRTEEERAALAEFMKLHPTAVQSGAARRRLAELDAQTGR